MKGKGKHKSKKQTKTSRKSNDQNPSSPLTLVNTHTDTDEPNTKADTHSATPEAGHAESGVSLSRRHHRPAGPGRPLRSLSSDALVPHRLGGLNRDSSAGDDVVACRTTVTRVSCSHPVCRQKDVPTRPTGGPLGTNVVSTELPAHQEQSGSEEDDEDTVVLQSEGSLNEDVDTVSESGGSERDVIFHAQRLQRSAANEVENEVSDTDRRSCRKSLQPVVENEEFDRRCSEKPMLSVVQNRMRDDSCHAQHLQRDVKSGIRDDSCSLKSLQFESENRKRDVSHRVQHLQNRACSEESENLLQDDHNYVRRNDDDRYTGNSQSPVPTVSRLVQRQQVVYTGREDVECNNNYDDDETNYYSGPEVLDAGPATRVPQHGDSGRHRVSNSNSTICY